MGPLSRVYLRQEDESGWYDSIAQNLNLQFFRETAVPQAKNKKVRIFLVFRAVSRAGEFAREFSKETFVLWGFDLRFL
jgi:hypothetical protein